MTTYYVPAIVPIAYPAVHGLCNGRLPDTFEEWRVRESNARRELVAQGHQVYGMALSPADLDRHCRSRNCRADADALADLAMRRGVETYGGEAEYARYRASTVVVDDVRVARPNDAIVEEVLPGRWRRPWWAFWRPRYQTVAVGAVRSGVVEDVPPYAAAACGLGDRDTRPWTDTSPGADTSPGTDTRPWTRPARQVRVVRQACR